MQTKLKLFSPEIVSALENKELPSHFRTYRKSAASSQTDGRTDSYTLVLSFDSLKAWRVQEEQEHYPVAIYLLKVNNRNTRTRCEIYSKLTIQTPERRQ